MSHGSGHSTAQTNDIGPLQNSTKSTQTTTTTTTKTQSQNFGVQKRKRQYLSKKKKRQSLKLPDKMQQFQLSPCYIQRKKQGGAQHFVIPEEGSKK